MILFDASHGQVGAKRSVFLRKPQRDHCTTHALGQRGQTIEGSPKTNPQYARDPVIRKHSEPVNFKSKGRNMGDSRLYDLADLVNLALRRITEKLQVDMEIFRFTP